MNEQEKGRFREFVEILYSIKSNLLPKNQSKV